MCASHPLLPQPITGTLGRQSGKATENRLFGASSGLVQSIMLFIYRDLENILILGGVLQVVRNVD